MPLGSLFQSHPPKSRDAVVSPVPKTPELDWQMHSHDARSSLRYPSSPMSSDQKSNKPIGTAYAEDFCLFFLGTSLICRPVVSARQHLFLLPFSRPGFCVLGGRLCLSLSAFSESVRTRVYRCLWHRTLNLICLEDLFFLIRAAARAALEFPSINNSAIGFVAQFRQSRINIHEASLRRQISMNWNTQNLSTMSPRNFL
jgi:hypothetical protein